MKKLFLLLLIAGIVLSSCTKSVSNPSPDTKAFTIIGEAQRINFEPAVTECKAYQLDDKFGRAVNGTEFKLKADNSYKFKIIAKQYVSLECIGKYHSELNSGRLTTDTIKLVALGDVTKDTKINLNLATTLVNDKVVSDYNRGGDFLAVYKIASEELFNEAGFQAPTKLPNELDAKDVSLHLLSRWFLQGVKLNPGKVQQDIADKYKGSFAQTQKLHLPAGYINESNTASIGKIGTHAKINGIAVNPSLTGINLGKLVSFELDGSVITGFQEQLNHVLLYTKVGSVGIELVHTGSKFTSNNIMSLFDGSKETTFKVCVVKKFIDTCESILPAQVQSFKATGLPASVLKALETHALVGGKDVGTSPRGIDTKQAVIFQMDADRVSNFSPNQDKILLSGKVGVAALELTADGNQHYSNTDIKSLFETAQETIFEVCIVERSEVDCSKSSQMRHFRATARILPSIDPFSGHVSVGGKILTGSGQMQIALEIGNAPVPLLINKGIIHNMEASQSLLVEYPSTHTKTMKLVDDGHQHYSIPDIRGLITSDPSRDFRGSQELRICIPLSTTMRCYYGERVEAADNIVIKVTNELTIFNFAGDTHAVNGHALVGGKDVGTSPTGIDTAQAVPFQMDKSIVQYFPSYIDHLIITSDKAGVTALVLTDDGKQHYSNADISSLFGTGETHFTICGTEKHVLNCSNTNFTPMSLQYFSASAK